MTDFQSIRINTAGAYVRAGERYVFAIGIRPCHGHIPIVRLGGHREGRETGWQCAVREVYEESRLKIEPIHPKATYACDWEALESGLFETSWQHATEQNPAPILVIKYHNDADPHLSLMYLAQTDGIPEPSSEVKGLVLLSEEEIHALCHEPITLGQYVARGGMALLNATFDTQLILEPLAQLRVLSRILKAQIREPGI